MKWNETLTIGVLLFIVIINSIVFNFIELSISLMPLMFNMVLNGLLFTFFIVVSLHFYSDLSTNFFNKNKDNSKLRIAIWSLLAGFNIFIAFQALIPGLVLSIPLITKKQRFFKK